jgi:hypothetical protein
VETLSEKQTEEDQVAIDMDSIPGVEVWEKFLCDLRIALSHLQFVVVCPILQNNQSILCVSFVENRLYGCL